MPPRPKVTITFTQPYTVKSVDGETYASGQTLKCTEDSANHFIKRGVAVLSEGDIAEKPPQDWTPNKPQPSAPEAATGTTTGTLPGVE